MKKILLVAALLLILSSCKESGEFNIKKVDAPKDYKLFEKIEENLDTVNAGTFLYNMDMKYSFLLDITLESDYEKYFPRYGIEKYTLADDNFTQFTHYKMAADFLRKGDSLQEAYRVISYYYVNRDNLEIFDFNQYILPYYPEFNPEQTDKIYDDYLMQTEAVRRINLSLLKARNMIKFALDNTIKNGKNEEKAMAHLMIAVSYLAQDRLYQLEQIKKHAALWKEFGGKDVMFMGIKDNKPLTDLLTYAAYNENTGVKEILKDGMEKGFLQIVLSKGGIYNYLNDDFYMPCGSALRNDKYALNPFYEKYGDYKMTATVLKLLISGQSEDDNDTFLKYKITNNFDKLYDNPVYIMPLNNVVYTVEMKNNVPYKVEFRNPAYFDVSYVSPLSNIFEQSSVFPKILSEYNIPFTQTSYLLNDNNTYKTVWDGNIRDQQPDSHKLFRFKGVIDCLDVSTMDMIFFCGSRENMIMAKNVHRTKCKDKVDCTINAQDLSDATH